MMNRSLLKVLLCTLFLFGINNSFAQISGTVFRDFNGNGIKGTTGLNIEPGVEGVIVNAYNASEQLVASYKTNAAGTYSIPSTGTYNGTVGSNTGSVANGINVRIEFVLPTASTSNIQSPQSGIDYSSTSGSAFGSSVQFVTGGSTSINYAINNPEEYVANTNPYISTSLQIAGTYNNATTGAISSELSFQYNSNGNPTGGQNLYVTDNVPNTKATTLQTGAIWGHAYQPKTKTMFISAALRRFAGLGPLGLGGIYKVNMTSPTSNSGATNFVDLNTIGINVGTDQRTASGCNSIGSAPNVPSNDIWASTKIGLEGIGGIDIDNKTNTLWLVNLHDSKLYGIQNINPSTTPTSTDVIGGYTISLPSPYTVVNGDLRAWGVKAFRGKIYVGAVANAINEPYPLPLTNLKGYVLKFDPQNPSAGFSVVHEFSFNYNRGYYGPSSGTDTWSVWQDIANNGSYYSAWLAQPMISDIEFDTDGSIILGVADRGAMQVGRNNYNSMNCNTSQWDGEGSGDILRLCKTSTGYTLGAGATGCTNTAPVGVAVSGVQEYYWGDFGPEADNTAFVETTLGGLAYLPGSNQVMSTSTDPENYHSNGVKTFNNTNGGPENNYNLFFSPYQTYTMAKANGLGDIEVISELPPLEIGNRVWLDANSDGIQNANEVGISGVVLQLYQGATLVGTTTTNSNGNYYFNSSNVTGGILENTLYEIRLSTSQTAVSTYSLSTANADATSNGDERDSDGSGSTTAIISVTTGLFGQNNHSYDFGFKSAPPCTIDAGTDKVACANDCVILTGTLPNTGTWTAMSTNPTGATLGTTTGGVAQVCYSSSAVGYYKYIYSDGSCSDTMQVRVGQLLDDFSAISEILIPNTSSIVTKDTTTDSPSILGGERDIYVVYTPTSANMGTGNAVYFGDFGTGGILDVAVGTSPILSPMIITYDGNDNNASALDATVGLGGINMLGLGSIGMKLDALDMVGPGKYFSVTLRVYSSPTNYSDAVYTINGGATGLTNISNINISIPTNTSSIGLGATGSADFGSVTAIQLIITTDQNGTDYTFSNGILLPCVGIPPTICDFTPSIISTSCNANGTDTTSSDDYMTFLLSPSADSVMAGKKYSVTATQNGNPIGITLSDGTPATGIYFGYPSPFKTATGTAGHGNIILTITASNGCSTTKTLTVTDPGTCNTITPTCSTGTVTYSYRTPFLYTDLNLVPLDIPKFNTLGGKRTLTQVSLNYSMNLGTNLVMENRAGTASTASFTINGDGMIDLGVTNIFTGAFSNISSGTLSFPAGILVPSGTNSSTWPGDSIMSSVPSTLERSMSLGLNDYLSSVYVNPSQSNAWVTRITGVPANDDDMKYFSGTSTISNSSNFNTPSTLAPFIGNGMVGLTASTLTGMSSSGGGGNIMSKQTTKAYASVTVTYTYSTPCISSVTAIASGCIGSNNQYNLTGAVTFTNPPTTGSLIVSIDGEATQIFNAPFTSPLNYTISNLNSDGLSKIVNAVFTVDTAAKNSTTFTAPVSCLVSPCGGTLLSETFHDSIPLQSTNWTLPMTIPQFNTNSGTRVLSKVVVTVKQKIKNIGVIESLDADTSTVNIQTTGNTFIKINTDTIITNTVLSTNIPQFVQAGILVPAQGTWTGDLFGSTLTAMSTMVNSSLTNEVDPRLNAAWVTNATGNSATDDDIAVFGPVVSSFSKNYTFISPTDLAKFIGTGNLPITANAKGASIAVGPGNTVAQIRTKASADVTVTYIYCDCSSFTTNAGADKTINCLLPSVTLGVASVSGNLYSWSPSTGLNSTTVAQPVSSTNATTTYTLTTTNSVGCVANDTVIVSVDKTLPIADAGQDKALTCTTTSSQIGTASISGNTYSWTPSIGLNDSTLAMPSASPNVSTTYSLTVTGSNGCIAYDNVAVTVNKNSPSVNAGVDDTITCSQTSATLGSASISGNTYSWSPTTSLNDATLAQPTATPTSNTVYTVTVTGANGCTASSTVSIFYNKTIPTADAGTDKTINCTITSVPISTAAILGNSYSWSPSTGLNATNIAQPTATPLVTTIYTVTVTNGVNGCSATSTMTVTVDNSLPIADAGATKNINCTTTSTTIGTVSVSGNTYSWLPTTGLSSTNIAQPTASPTTTTTYTVTVTGSNGCSATSSVAVNVNTIVPTADAGGVYNLTCSVTNTTIGTAAVSGNSYSWSPSTGLNDSTLAQPSASPSTNTNYTVTVISSNGCTATDIATVNVSSLLPVADAGPNKTINCTTTSTTIGTVGLVGKSYSWSPSTGLNAINIAQPTANPTATTTYTVTVTNVSSGCSATSTVLVTVDKADSIPIINGNLTVCNGSTTTLTASGGSTYEWSNSDLTSTTNVGIGTYTVTVTSTNGCSSTTSATVVNAQGSVGNYVWFDENKNGINDEAATAGINGLAVELWKETAIGSNNYVLDQTTTTATNSGNPGYYNFIICESANYKVKFPTTNSNDILTSQTATAATDDNSDANATTGESPVFAIDVTGSGVAKDNTTIDAGYITPKACLGNYVWNDINRDGTQNTNEVGVAGITVTLYNTSNVVIASTITDAYGYYQFCPVEPNTYKVGFTLPANYMFTTKDGASTDATDSDVDPMTGLTTTYTLVNGDSNMTVDAGIYFDQPTTASVGNYVWYDTDQDGIQDATETGISGVTVTLYDNNNLPIRTMITDANGFYLFTNVNPGTYSVGFTQPIGLTFSPNNSGVNDASNSDANTSTGKTASFTVVAGDKITYVDAGLYSQPTNIGGLGDKVWYDENQNGVQDASEIGVAGVTVTLYQADGLTSIASTTTDAYGNYIFNNLPQGQYVVGFTNLPANYVFTNTTGTDSTTNSDANTITNKTTIINLGAGQFNMTYDAGIYTTISANNNSLGNFVWDDVNKDGIQDANEVGVSGVTVTLYDNATNTILNTTSTNTNGYYLFPDLPNGSYYVGFTNLPVGYVFSPMGEGTTATDNNADNSTGLTSAVTLSGNTHDMTIDAGINLGDSRIGLASLGDLVWYDMNNNGLQDNGEAGTPGVTVTLYEANGTTAITTTTTDALGNYIFTGLTAGSYVVGFTNLPSGFTISTQNADGLGINGEMNSDVNPTTQKTTPIALAVGEDKMSVDMGIVPPTGSASLGNFVWFDLNNDGLQTTGEPGVQGVGVTLYDNTNTAIKTTTTDANGEYYFVGLTPGTYSVGFNNLPSGYTFTTFDANTTGINGANNSDANATTGLTATVTLLAGDNNLNLDAGIKSTIVASVGDYVWYDMNRDGIQDASEPGIGGVLVTLYDNTNTAVASTITHPDGSYIFTNVNPGNYTIGFTNIPFGMEFTSQETNPTSNTGSNVNPTSGLTPSFTVTAGTHNPTIDAGLKTPFTGGLGNYVWHDLDIDGTQDANEPGVPGVVVTLYSTNGTTVLATAITNGSGAYSFPNLQDGDYIVGFSNLPAGSTKTYNLGAVNEALNSDMGADNKTGIATVSGGNYNPNVDAGIYFGIPLNAKELKATTAIINATNTSCNVNWYTIDEMNTKLFTIERSENGVNFEAVGTTNAKGNTNTRTNYLYTDDIKAVTATTIYYRIKLTDIDGKQSFSNIINVKRNENGTSEIVVYPIPFTDLITIVYPTTEATTVDVQLTDVTGKVIRKMSSDLEVGNNTIQLEGLSNLSSGTYFVRFYDINSGINYSQKIVK